jgi:hypothetical protein
MEFVLIKSFNDEIEANIVQGMLEANGIVCWLQDEILGRLRLYSNGIKLMVREDQVQKALDLIDASKNQNVTF